MWDDKKIEEGCQKYKIISILHCTSNKITKIGHTEWIYKCNAQNKQEGNTDPALKPVFFS